MVATSLLVKAVAENSKPRKAMASKSKIRPIRKVRVIIIDENCFFRFSRNSFGTAIGTPVSPFHYPLCRDLPTPFPPRQAVPKGLCENSPAFQRREKVPETSSPEGTVE